MRNLELAEIFDRIADMLEIKGENSFKVRAYRKVVLTLENLPEDIQRIYELGRLRKIPGVGEGIAKKIEELLKTGKLGYYEELKKSLPEGLVNLLLVPDVGPKTAQLLYSKLGIASINELEKAAASGRIKNLDGMGEKTEENILRGIELLRRRTGRMLLGTAFQLSHSIIERLSQMNEVERINSAGSLRRMKETIGDIDILITSPDPKPVMDVFVNLPEVTRVLAHGDTKSSVIVENRVQVDVRVVKNESFGAALQYFTGSKQHNIKIREFAAKKGLKVNEYGVFKIKGGKKIGGEDEKEVYNKIGIPYIPPELREDRGEIEAALGGKLPELVELGDIKGDLHIHSLWSDGVDTIPELADSAKKIGYRYIAVCDHSESLKVAGGIEKKRKLQQIEEIRKLNDKLSGFRILAGAEVDIKTDGTIDYDDEVLEKLDIVVAAIHTGFKQDVETMTSRIIKAMRNKFVNVIAHPTGRLIQAREGYEVDMHRLLKTARETGTMMELNSFPDRLDLSDVNCREAKEQGVMVSLGTDCHNRSQLDVMRYGVGTARRGWLEKKDIANCLELDALLKRLSPSLKKRG